MKLLLTTLILFVSFYSQAQTSIKLEDVSKHVGDSVTVCGKVSGGVYMAQSNQKLTLLNVGAAFPNQVFTIVINNELRTKFETAPETFFLDKEVCVTGKVSLYRDAPQIVIYKKEQIQVPK